MPAAIPFKKGLCIASFSRMPAMLDSSLFCHAATTECAIAVLHGSLVQQFRWSPAQYKEQLFLVTRQCSCILHQVWVHAQQTFPYFAGLCWVWQLHCGFWSLTGWLWSTTVQFQTWKQHPSTALKCKQLKQEKLWKVKLMSIGVIAGASITTKYWIVDKHGHYTCRM